MDKKENFIGFLRLSGSDFDERYKGIYDFCF